MSDYLRQAESIETESSCHSSSQGLTGQCCAPTGLGHVDHEPSHSASGCCQGDEGATNIQSCCQHEPASAQVVPGVTEGATPLPIIAYVAKVVTRVVDRLCSDRADYPLLVASACADALGRLGVKSQVMYGQAAWIEILEDSSPVWAGCWGGNTHFWVLTEYSEVVDLNLSVAVKKGGQTPSGLKAKYSPPMLWSRDLPGFCRFFPEGVAELDLVDEADKRRYRNVLAEIAEHCDGEAIRAKLSAQSEADLDFPNEAILCPGRRLLDDSRQTFLHYDRALGIYGLPESPI